MSKGLEARLTLSLPGFTLDAALHAPARGVTALFGPSGAGKTQLIRAIAGLVPRARGVVRLNGETWQDERTFLPPHRRAIGYVFQEPSLFGHLDVLGNLLYGFKRVPPGERRLTLERVTDWLGLTPLLARGVARLSGGERQRVAMGRALLVSPRLLLLDEPMAALDGASKQEIMPYLEALHRELEIPVLYVSHSLDEVARLADAMVLMAAGRVVARGGIDEMLARLDLPMSHGGEAGVVVAGRVGRHDAAFHLTWLEFPGGGLWLGRAGHVAVGEAVRVRVLARDVSIALEPARATSILNTLPARVEQLADDGPTATVVRLQVGETIFLSRITRRSCHQLGLHPGLAVQVQVKSVALAQ